MALKTIDDQQTPKTNKSPHEQQKENSLDDVVTSDEKFEKVLAEPQKRERCREEKESNKKKEKGR